MTRPSPTVCTAHSIPACIVCMCNDFHDWLCSLKMRRAQLKRERRETPVEERFDLGGES